MTVKPCLLCVFVSVSWLLGSALYAWGYLSDAAIIPIALLMGGSVVGVSQRVERKWRPFIVLVGLVLAYLAVTHITKTTVVLELFALLGLGYVFFVEWEPRGTSASRENSIIRALKNCCD